MATQSLFTSQTPAQNNQNDGTPTITRGVTLTFSAAGQITHVRWWCPVATTGTYTVGVWELTSGTSGTLLDSKTHVGVPTLNDWNVTALNSPITINTSKAYRIGVNNSEGRYVSTGAFFGSSLTNGNIVAEPHNGTAGGFTINQATFDIGSGLAFPNGTFNSTNYFVDVVFDTGGASTPAPNGIAGTITLGTPSVSLNLSTTPSGIAATVALGTPTVALNRSAAPSGIGATVGLGQPNVTSTPGPNGISVTVALGPPSVSLNRSAAPSGISVSVLLGTPAAVIVSAPSGISVSVLAGSPSVSATVLTAGAPGSWYGLKVTDDLNRRYAREGKGTPLECPNDGTPLQRNPRTGQLQCNFDGYVYLGW